MIIKLTAIFFAILVEKRTSGTQIFSFSSSENEKRLFGGFYSAPVEFFVNTTFYYVNGGSIACSGVLISEQHVLTAAHSIYDVMQTNRKKGLVPNNFLLNKMAHARVVR